MLEELNNYKPMSICNWCNCGRLKSILELHSQERVFQFLIGLNDSFSTVRAQIILIDPLPSINKVFSLFIQEEKQREITVSSLSHEFVALMTKYESILISPPTHIHELVVLMTKSTPGPRFAKLNYRNDRPICSHCRVSGHTIENYYKVHGYPPGFKFTWNKSVPY